jgi:very-short-patch-repair endonuclease
MAKHQMIVLRFTPKQIRSEPAEVIKDIKAALENARGRPPLALRTTRAAA